MSIVRSLKARTKQILINRQHNKYAEALQKEKKNYDEWIRHKERGLQLENEGNLSFAFLTFAECGLDVFRKVGSRQEDILVFYQNSGEPSQLAKPLIAEFMFNHPSVFLIYGDEDQIDEDGKRKNPWFKPDWSPDSFLAAFYLGSIFAVRREQALTALQKLQENGNITDCPEQNLYELCRELAAASGGFEKRSGGNIDRFPIGHISEVLFHGKQEPVVRKGEFPEEYVDCSGQLVSVIIPSKDHPDILARCITSFVQYTRHKRYQFVVVDNGSNQENKKAIESLLEKLNQEESHNYSHLYIYKEMPFNFSRMCNIGAAAVHEEAELLLFLNDDMEILQEDWLEKLAGKALIPRVGAVGAKLLYPDSDIIQHAGVTNLRVGPAHKLQYLSDQEEYYFGKNRGVHNMAAVTGACLMVRKSVFAEAGGFQEELAVAFNDVDLCYSIWEAGYVNVVLNDVILYHHESLSRGKDGESEEKGIRLRKENDALYRRHQRIYAKDPFYHKYLMSDMLMPEYALALHYEVDLGMPWAEVTPDGGKIAGYPEDACLRVGVECTTDIFKWKYGITAELFAEEASVEAVSDVDASKETFSAEEAFVEAVSAKEAIAEEKYAKMRSAELPLVKGAFETAIDVTEEDKGYYLQGYSFVIGGDNACYQRTLLMKDLDRGGVWKIFIETRYRPDVREALKDQLNVDLAGFSVKIKRDALPPGNYLFGMAVKDKCSRQRLVNWSERKLTIK